MENPNTNLQIISRVDGRGNNIKTEIINAHKIAEFLHRPVEQFIKFLGLQFGCYTKVILERAFIYGAFNVQDIQKHVDTYIEKYVRCFICNDINTLQKLEKQDLVLSCIRCGQMSDVDQYHKMTGIIVKSLIGVKTVVEPVVTDPVMHLVLDKLDLVLKKLNDLEQRI